MLQKKARPIVVGAIIVEAVDYVLPKIRIKMITTMIRIIIITMGEIPQQQRRRPQQQQQRKHKGEV